LIETALYVVATPIGNLEDITSRAIQILGDVDMIAAEDTRHSRVLLSQFNIKTPMFSCHKFNEGKRGDFFVDALNEGKSVALISDAGTPCISDPGNILVRTVAQAGFPVIAVCGASASIAALSVSGFDVTHYMFLGFLPRTKKDIMKIFEMMLKSCYTTIFYESPRRIKATIGFLNEHYPTAEICLCNDLTKKFEKLYRGSPTKILFELENNPNAEKGEYTCVVNFPYLPTATNEENTIDSPSIESLLVDIMIKTQCTLKDAIGQLKQKTNMPKKEIYAATLRLKELF